MPKSEDTRVEKSKFISREIGRGWLLGALAVVLLFLAFVFGVGIGNHHRAYRTNAVVGLHGPMAQSFLEKEDAGSGFPLSPHGGTVTIDGKTFEQGVVTAVNGSNFTLASHGATTKVVTNGSTQYQNGNQVKQNDSVVVTGTLSGSTLTATHITINP